jgi:hypothetical protein
VLSLAELAAITQRTYGRTAGSGTRAPAVILDAVPAATTPITPSTALEVVSIQPTPRADSPRPPAIPSFRDYVPTRLPTPVITNNIFVNLVSHPAYPPVSPPGVLYTVPTALIHRQTRFPGAPTGLQMPAISFPLPAGHNSIVSSSPVRPSSPALPVVAVSPDQPIADTSSNPPPVSTSQIQPPADTSLVQPLAAMSLVQPRADSSSPSPRDVARRQEEIPSDSTAGRTTKGKNTNSRLTSASNQHRASPVALPIGTRARIWGRPLRVG